MAITDFPYDNSEAEFMEMRQFLITTYAITRWPHNWLFARWEDWRYGGNAQQAKADPTFFTRNAHLWRDETGKIIGFCVSEYGSGVYIQIHPSYRFVEREMIRWIVDEWARDRDEVEVYAYSVDARREKLLREAGFVDTGEGGNTFAYDLAKAYAPVPLPSGFCLTTLAENRDFGAHLEAVRDTFAQPAITHEWLESKQRAPGYSMDWDLVIVSPEGKHASFCTAWLDHENRIAAIDPVGTHADYRRRGLATAVLTECFRRLRAAGMHCAYLDSAPEPNISNRLYTSLHPTARYVEKVWAKKMA